MENTASIAAAAMAILSSSEAERGSHANNININPEEGAGADEDDAHEIRQIPSIDSDDHPLKRLVLPHHHHQHEGHHQHHPLHRAHNPDTADNSFSSNIFHKRSQSDTATLLEQHEIHNNNNESELIDPINSRLRRPVSKDESRSNSNIPGGSGAGGVVTFADTPTAGIKTFDGNLARRRHSATASSHTTTTTSASAPSSPAAAVPPLNLLARGRVYRSSIATDKLTTRDIAALDFLLGIPLEAEETIVHHGWMLQQQRKLQSKQAGADDGSDEDEDYGDETKREEDGLNLEPPNTGAGFATPTWGAASHHGKWWEKWIGDANRKASPHSTDHSTNKRRNRHEDVELELPTALHNHSHGGDMASTYAIQHPQGTPTTDATATQSTTNTPGGSTHTNTNNNIRSKSHEPVALPAPVYAPGRRLEGDEAVIVQIPLTVDTVTRQKSIARQAAIREWELKVAHGLGGPSTSSSQSQPPLLDGRLFFSAAGSYPMAVFSLKRYEPKREEAALRRQKLEARGGGGSHFVMPSRDWRGISYRVLLPRKAEQARNQKAFNRFLRDSKVKRSASSPSKKNRSQQPHLLLHDDNHSHTILSDSDEDDDDDDDDDSSTVSNSSSEDSYIPGILDDPEMTLGRHRNVMIGDCVTGCIVASTIQFVKPTLLKADLNQKFRERFDGWEPNKSQRKYIGARVIDGVYTLVDPTDDANAESENQGSEDSTQPAIVRMPPSLTLSKIRSVKRQALLAFVKANLEVGTVALACVYFERLCLSCRVDKSNRRLCFASCLLLATKINEPNEVLVMKEEHGSGADSGTEDNNTSSTRKKFKRLQSSIRPNKRSSSMFASLLEFFTQDWSLSLKHLFAAEWGVFAALRFSLHATPSQVAFHFKRLMKTLEWNPLHYLGSDMYNQWTNALGTEDKRRMERERRREVRRMKKERRIQRELEKEVMRGKQLVETELLRKRSNKGSTLKSPPSAQQQQQHSKAPGRIPISPLSLSPRDDRSIRQSIPRFSGRQDSGTGRQDSSSNNYMDSSQSEATDTLLGRRGVMRSLSTKSAGQLSSTNKLSPKKQDRNSSIRGDAVSSSGGKKSRSIKLLHRLGMSRRPASDLKLHELAGDRDTSEQPSQQLSASLMSSGSERGTPRSTVAGLPLSPSMPLLSDHFDLTETQEQQHIAIDMPPDAEDASNTKDNTPNEGDEELGETSSVNNGVEAGLPI